MIKSDRVPIDTRSIKGGIPEVKFPSRPNVKLVIIRCPSTIYSLFFDRGSLGPSTVTLIALPYVVTCTGLVDTVMVSVKLFPGRTRREKRKNNVKSCSVGGKWCRWPSKNEVIVLNVLLNWKHILNHQLCALKISGEPYLSSTHHSRPHINPEPTTKL